MNVRANIAVLILFSLFAGLFGILSAPAQAASLGATDGGRYPNASCDLAGGAVNPDLTWVGHVVGCGTDVDQDLIDHLTSLRDSGCEGLRSQVPARQIVDRFSASLGSRTEAVTLLTATSVYCYGG